MLANAAGMIAKYLATSLAMLKVVSAPRVMSICLPVSTTSSSFVGLESRSIMLPGFLRRLGAGVHGHGHVGLGQRRRVVGAVAGHGHQPAFRLDVPDQLQLGLGRGLGEEIVHARPRR